MKRRGLITLLATTVGTIMAVAHIEVDPLGAFTAVGLALCLMGHMQAEHDHAH